MFNSLQEGILVINEYIPKNEETSERVFKLYFANQLCNIIMGNLFGMKNFLQELRERIKNKTLKETDVLQKKIFFKYRSSKTANLQ